MDITEIVLIVIIIKCLIILFVLYRFTYKICHDVKLRDYEISRSDEYVKNNIGRLTSIIGAVKTGKSSLLTALSQSATRVIKNELVNRLESIKNDLYYLDFNKVDEFLINKYQDTNDYNLVADDLFNSLEINNYLLHDFTNIKISYELVKDYAELFYHLNVKSNYIFSKGISMYDRENDCPSTYLLDDMLEIKNIKDTHCWYFEKASVIAEDEKSVSDSNVKSNDREEKESGKKEFKIFFGHISKELSYYFTTRQIEADEIVTTRRLNITTYETKRAVLKIYNFPNIQRLCDKLIRFKGFFFKMRFLFVVGKNRKLNKMYAYYNSSKCKFRKFIAKMNNIKNFCDSEGLLIHEGNLYNYSPIDGKLTLIDNQVELAFPYSQSRGVYNCYEFACIDDELRHLSNININDVPFTQRFGTGLDSEKVSFLYEKSKKKKEETNLIVSDEF